MTADADEWARGYSDGRAGRDSASQFSTNRDKYLDGFLQGNHDRGAQGWAS